MDYVLNVLQAVVGIVNEMSPYLLLGFLLAGIMHAFIPDGWFNKYLSGDTMRSVINAAIFGVPLPLCSCGVIPTAMSLRREGASKGAVVSFLIATPQTGVDSIFATYSLMGLPFAIVRPIAALFTAVMGGAFVTLETHPPKTHPSPSLQGGSSISANEGCNAETNEQGDHSLPVGRVRGGSWRVGERVISALRFGFVEMMEDIGKWLVVGLIVAGLITALVPDEFFAIFKDNTALSMLLVLCISVPMYICATGSIPIAVALMMKGLTPGAALVMLMAGPACNVASILVINKVLGKKTLLLYLAAIITGSILFGVAIDQLLPREWFTDHLMSTHACCHDVAGWFEWTCTGILVLLLLNVLRMKLQHKSACSCGHCHTDPLCPHGHLPHNGESHAACSSTASTHGHCHCHDAACSSTANTPDGSPLPITGEGQGERVFFFHIKGMTCNHCRANVEKVIRSVKGVESVSVDLQSGVATVTGDDIDDKAVKEAVESIGFTLEE